MTCTDCREVSSGLAMCEIHKAQAERDYPQGWRHYPGDVCPHGKYVGGVGIDLMCGACEIGEEE